MKEWIVENIFKSRTAWAALLALIVGVITWAVAVPKDLASWIALGSFLVAVFAGWTAVNKVGDNIATKIQPTDEGK